MKDSIKFSRTRDVNFPSRGTSRSAGIDFYVPNDYNNGAIKLVNPGENVLIPSGIKANVPSGYALIAFNKSGICTKRGLYAGACVVDEDYQGEIHIHVTNVSNESTAIESGDKIMQFILIPVSYSIPFEIGIDDLYSDITDRGENGFGSTDSK